MDAHLFHNTQIISSLPGNSYFIDLSESPLPAETLELTRGRASYFFAL